MGEPRPEKVALVEEVRQRLDGAAASVVTEYRGLTVAELAELRRALAAVGSDYKVFKNTLVRRAVADSAHRELEPLLSGPTAIAFVHEDLSAAAKALRQFSRTYPRLVVKGGLSEGALLSQQDLATLAELPPRDVLRAQFASALAAPLRQLASLLQALPQNLAFGLAALRDQRGPEEAGGAGQAGRPGETEQAGITGGETPPPT